MQTVELKHAYRLLNHGPTVMLGSAHGGRSNVMADGTLKTQRPSCAACTMWQAVSFMPLAR